MVACNSLNCQNIWNGCQITCANDLIWRSLTMSQICEQLIALHVPPTSTVITLSKSQSQTVDNKCSTLTKCSKNTSTSCELHGTNTFRTNGGVHPWMCKHRHTSSSWVGSFDLQKMVRKIGHIVARKIVSVILDQERLVGFHHSKRNTIGDPS